MKLRFSIRDLLWLTLVVLAVGCEKPVKLDTLTYELYALNSNSGRDLLAKGTITCDGQNVQSIEQSAFGNPFWQKYVPLEQDFVVGASVHRQKELDGFGLWLKNKSGGFSWNWFTRESGLTYRELKGTSKVEATLAQSTKYAELVAVEFLEDVTLTANLGWLPFKDTHHVVIKKGSILRLSP